MAELRVAFRLPLPEAPRLVFVSDYGLRGGRLLAGDRLVLEAPSREALERGVMGRLPGSRKVLTLRAAAPDDIRLTVDGVEVPSEDRLRAPISRSAWVDALLALGGSLFGFAASWLYLRRAGRSGDPFAMKMAMHMAAWHLLLVLTLLPLSLFGQRMGIRVVQCTCLVFFFIHVGIALANTRVSDGPWIGLLNAGSGLGFLLAALYGFRAHADMDPFQRQPAGVQSGSMLP